MALGRKIVDLGRPDLLHQADQVGRIRHVAIVQQERHIAGVRIFVEMIDARGIERGRPPLDAVDRVAEAKQIFGEIGAVLPGDAGEERNAPVSNQVQTYQSPKLLQTATSAPRLILVSNVKNVIDMQTPMLRRTAGLEAPPLISEHTGLAYPSWSLGARTFSPDTEQNYDDSQVQLVQ